MVFSSKMVQPGELLLNGKGIEQLLALTLAKETGKMPMLNTQTSIG